MVPFFEHRSGAYIEVREHRSAEMRCQAAGIVGFYKELPLAPGAAGMATKAPVNPGAGTP